MGYIRFVVHELDSNSHVRSGIFQALAKLRDEGHLPPEEARRARDLQRWFGENLPEPSRFSRKRIPNPRGNRGISWFKDSATLHISRVREAVAILEAHDVDVEMITTEKPGYLLYEDEFQIVAQPFSETAT